MKLFATYDKFSSSEHTEFTLIFNILCWILFVPCLEESVTGLQPTQEGLYRVASSNRGGKNAVVGWDFASREFAVGNSLAFGTRFPGVGLCKADFCGVPGSV